MDVTRTQTGEFRITSEAILQIVKAYFGRISPVQWTMLSNGRWDLETKQILLSMFVQLVQSLSAGVLQLVIPMNQVNVRCMNEKEATRAFQTITTVLQESVGEIFARALNVPFSGVDTSHDSQELTFLIEQEVSQKVNSALAAASGEEQVGVASSLTSTDVGRLMVDKAKACLKSCLNVLSCSCASTRSCTTSPVEERDGPTARAASESSGLTTKKGPCHCCFSMFARMNFRKMQQNLDDKIPSLVREPEATTPVGSGPWSTPGSSSIRMSPGALRTMSPPVSAGALSRTQYLSKSPEIDFETIRRDVDEMFLELDMAKGPGSAASQRRLEEALKGEDIMRFSQRLTDIMYHKFDLMDCSAQPVSPISSRQRSPSTDNLLLVNAGVKEEVATYLQKLVTFMQRDPLDIFDRDLFELSMESRPVSTPVPVPRPVSTGRQTSVSAEESNAGQSFSNRRYDLFERSMVHPKACVPSNISRDVPAVVLRTPRPDSQGQCVTQVMIAALMIKIFQKKMDLQPGDKMYQVIYNRLVKKAWEEIEISDDQIKPIEKKLRKIIDGVRRDLLKEYGTANRMLLSALDETDGSFDAKVVAYLQMNLQVNLQEKESLLSRAFRIISNPFCCCRGPY